MAAYSEAVILALAASADKSLGRETSGLLSISTTEARNLGYELPIALDLVNSFTPGYSFGMSLKHNLAIANTPQSIAALHLFSDMNLAAASKHKLGQGAFVTMILSQETDALVGRGSVLTLLLNQQAAKTLGHGNTVVWSLLLGALPQRGLSAVQTVLLGVRAGTRIGKQLLAEFAMGIAGDITPRYQGSPQLTHSITITQVPQAQAALHNDCMYVIQLNYQAQAGNECVGWLHRDGATWEYTGISVKGLTVMNNTIIISNVDGIYKLTGSDNVVATLDTGDTDFDTQQHKRIPQVWIDRGDAAQDYIEIINNDTAYRYPLETNLRYRIGRGLESVYWRMKFIFKRRAAFSKLLVYPLVLARNLIRGGNDPRE